MKEGVLVKCLIIALAVLALSIILWHNGYKDRNQIIIDCILDADAEQKKGEYLNLIK
jgi:hypothetical protein